MTKASSIASGYTEICGLSRGSRRSFTWGLVGQKPPEQQFVHWPTKALFAIDVHHGHAFVVPFSQHWISIDIDQPRRQAIALQHRERLIAEMASVAGVECCSVHGWRAVRRIAEASRRF